MANDKAIWVVAQLEDGKLLNVTLELLGKAKELAAKAGTTADVVLLAATDDGLSAKCVACGADTVYTVLGPELAEYDTEIYTNALCELIGEYHPGTVMFGATIDGRDLAPRVAARLGTGLCADCTALDIEETGLVKWTRPAMGGNLYGTIVCAEHRPQMGSIRPKVFEPLAEDPSRKGDIVAYTVKNPVTSPMTVLKKEPLSTGGKRKIEDADVVVCGGRGMGDAEQFRALEDLADLFEKGAVAGTRAAVDEKWVDHASQVGQSGKTIKPDVYFAFGVSGAMQHTSGMKDSGLVIAVNKDENAPIFEFSHIGVVGDARKILPLLTAKLKELKK
ncbi:MAG: electron transfer flavoprotein subunit alpha/FixB family protein [Succiniclasticum sp.]|jgi:electron transfer flavoprotein alpha subunit|nr:electron transfer flavoprotein subunit alpha/FixB family protein [Selenomonadales bacterium]MDY2870557.1 electron transfer flavoprotein subunit alpha/FixB family protein [Succiniclasticum sp.]MDY6303933.1 electron transfer flavoprotein subunit alpha/FixB family protein [Succiniclasticum sp.]MDY6346079.1 electron transfer flavoprotein subunit alpha/FixB family protein [Succiniclasticum sp.]